mmetsp:Transcript_29219/g.50495  ORF Transcript_29219/g.50495 Transcript_29219/m.50495 type:complete len:219 (+) Transcript_29219:304-960(+)
MPMPPPPPPPAASAPPGPMLFQLMPIPGMLMPPPEDMLGMAIPGMLMAGMLMLMGRSSPPAAASAAAGPPTCGLWWGSPLDASVTLGLSGLSMSALSLPASEPPPPPPSGPAPSSSFSRSSAICRRARTCSGSGWLRMASTSCAVTAACRSLIARACWSMSRTWARRWRSSVCMGRYSLMNCAMCLSTTGVASSCATVGRRSGVFCSIHFTSPRTSGL